MDKAVILARGLGTRMRKTDESANLSAEQAAIANAGIKALIRIDRPFLDYLLGSLADAGYRRICLVIGPEHDLIRDYVATLDLHRLSIDFAIQEKPLGTADAVAAAEPFAGSDAFLCINSDNYYPEEALAGLRELDGPGLAGFQREGMLAGSNIPADRISKFACIRSDERGNMAQILEKPAPEVVASLPEPICLSMNCWRFGPEIFPACAAIEPSPRGELEITDAVQYAIDHGTAYRVLPVNAPVLDMSSRGDIEPVKQRLLGKEVRL
jgi:glucose-1-phosphate thymidylyltransferase